MRKTLFTIKMSWPPDAPYDLVQFGLHLLLLPYSLLPLHLCIPKLLLQLLYTALLIPFAVLEARQGGYEVLDLLFLDDQVARQFELAGFEFIGG